MMSIKNLNQKEKIFNTYSAENGFEQGNIITLLLLDVAVIAPTRTVDFPQR